MSDPSSRSRRVAAYGVHLLTASGIFPAGLAAFEITQPDCDPRWVLVLLLLTTVIDGIDGPLARRLEVKRYAAAIDGRTIDDLLDYLTFAFLPLLLIWRMEWLPEGFGWTVMLAMGASLLGFANVQAKDEQRGMFRGFPSYWNAFALYAGVFSATIHPWLTAVSLWALTALTVAPVWLIYPNLCPAKWKASIMGGAIAWVALMLAMLIWFPHPPLWLTILSLVYPAYYGYASWRVHRAQ